ncbi:MULTISPECIES: DUF6249 domain-containing protein [unclassified Brevundimonas]|uniref:DUF6249 domain-containing protein n=1 Tax=unclassified Brevundimonas TaxID=2622653 RepID=UPI0006F90743|nr:MULTISPECIES: DUF6249 domain-containing protein [unclassified Brevundimonas]KQY87006.1 hypothetical protein ASD25_21975 [Brevundimonas sp. Root1423]KRA29130.1 hypothetical protein ASD59_04915 [Brevundimonas sp. Root608]
MNLTPILIVLIIFTAITAVIFGPSYLKSREKRDIQTTVRHAIDKGQQLPADLIDAMTRDVASKLPSRTRDLRRGVIWLAVGVGLTAFGYMTQFGWHDHDVEGVAGGLMGIAAIPATIGLAFIILSFFNPNKE